MTKGKFTDISDLSINCIQIFALKFSINVWIKQTWDHHPKKLSAQCCHTAEAISCILTGSWVGGEVLNHASLHDWDPPAAKDNSIYCNDSWKQCSQNSELYEITRKELLCPFSFIASYLWQSSVLRWGCSRSHPPWTSTVWAAAGSQTACSTSHANVPCPGSPANRLSIIIIYYSGWGRDFVLLNLTCEIFSAFSSSLVAWTLNFSVSYCRMAAAPNEQPVNWHEIHLSCCSHFRAV